MKHVLTAIMLCAIVGCVSSVALAAELLDVKPVVSGSAVSIEVTADIPMTYTYYKVPGQARAVVDIAEADPEKVEPLIVVNKGAVSSISVDKAQISGIVVSRIIFNLVSESEIAVNASSDRKLLTVTFTPLASSSAKPQTKPEPKAEPDTDLETKTSPKPEPKPAPTAEPAAKAEPPATTKQAAGQEEDPLGLDEPAAKQAAPISKIAAATALAAPPAVVTKVAKLEPVVPAATAATPPPALTVKNISTGTSYIEIRANRAVVDYKTFRLAKPNRLVVDIIADKISQKSKTVAINKFGVSKARIGVSAKSIRIVLDSGKAGFPAHTITNTEDGLRINFK